MRSAQTVEYDPVISWKTLIGYVRAVLEFTKAKAPRLPDASLARIPAADLNAPPAQPFLVPGGRLGYRRYIAATSRRALILVHGSAGFGDQFHTMARLLAKWDLAEVYTLDMRGHGLSHGVRGHAATAPTQMVDDVLAFVAHVGAEGSAERVILGGHSAGGGLVLAASRCAASELIDGYIFLAPFLGLGSPVSRRHFGGWVKVRVARLIAVAAANLLGIEHFNNTTVLQFEPRACARDSRYAPSWSFNTVLAFGPGRWIKPAAPISPDKPVLLIAGEADECFNHNLYAAAFHMIAPHAEIPDVGAIGHWDILVDPKAVTTVGGWLSAQAATRRDSDPLAISARSTSRSP